VSPRGDDTIREGTVFLRISTAMGLCALATACTAAAYLNGARIVRAGQSANGAVATWDVGMCTDASGAPAGAPAIRYHLLESATGPELYERGTDGSGSIVENKWTDERGTHFYQWVRRTGWEIIITEPGQPGVRNVYLNTRSTNGRPDGAIGATCPLTPSANPS
jgi:hypothetical protein